MIFAYMHTLLDWLTKRHTQAQDMLRGPEARSLQPKPNGVSSKDAKNRIQAERAQLYEKLAKSESSVDPYLHLFSVSAKEKKKKYVVATSICTSLTGWEE